MTILYLFVYLSAFPISHCTITGWGVADCGSHNEIVIEKFEKLADLNAFIRKNGIGGTVVNMKDGHIAQIVTQPVYKTVTEEKRVVDYYVWDVK
jgi:hypothetical protein